MIKKWFNNYILKLIDNSGYKSEKIILDNIKCNCVSNFGNLDWGYIYEDTNNSYDWGLITEYAPPVKYFLELEGV